jgi:hypothetical protein
LLSRKPQFADPEFERVSSTVTRTVAQDKTWWESIKANLTGLAFETQLVDRFAGFERLAKYMEPLKGTQMLYYLRSYDQRMNIVSKAVSDGAPSIREITRDDGRVERLVETTGGASIAGVVNKLKEANQYIGNGEAVNQVFTTYMAAIRAKNKGIETLNFGKDKDGKPVLTQEMLDEVTALVNKNAAAWRRFLKKPVQSTTSTIATFWTLWLAPALCLKRLSRSLWQRTITSRSIVSAKVSSSW